MEFEIKREGKEDAKISITQDEELSMETPSKVKQNLYVSLRPKEMNYHLREESLNEIKVQLRSY